MSRCPNILYRVPGHLSPRSCLFVQQLKSDGEDPEIIKNFEQDLPKFESYCIGNNFEEAVLIFWVPPPEKYHEYLKGLVRHIRAVTAAERAEMLHWQACNADMKTAAKAMQMLGDFDRKQKP